MTLYESYLKFMNTPTGWEPLIGFGIIVLLLWATWKGLPDIYK